MKRTKLLTGISTICATCAIPFTLATTGCNQIKTINVSLIKGYEKLYKINKTEALANEDLSVILESKDGVTPIDANSIYVVTKGAEIPTDWYKIEQSIDDTQVKITLDKEDVFADIQIGVFEAGLDMRDYVADGEYVSDYTPLSTTVYNSEEACLNAYISCIEKDPHIFEDDCYCNLNYFLVPLQFNLRELKAGFKVLDFDKDKKTISYDASIIIDYDQVAVPNSTTKFSIDVHFENVKLCYPKPKFTISGWSFGVTTQQAYYAFGNMIGKPYDISQCITEIKNDKGWKMTLDAKVEKIALLPTTSASFTDLSLDYSNFETSPFYNKFEDFSEFYCPIAYTTLIATSPEESHYFQNATLDD